ncbi:solute carrier family 35 member B like protein [Babesia gibsoni]|uniref:Solute carrier family 35 member B like protein n=1 Tax=Babesia gibsoni TaxID=33632 RepID=A0AAD8LQ17_BABGI|nr:solute carrier family 35 member B like protein [Babesia gibsoni]
MRGGDKLKPYRRGADAESVTSSSQRESISSKSNQLQNGKRLSYTKRLFKLPLALHRFKMQIPIETEATKAERRKAMLKEIGLAVVLFSVVCVCYITYQLLQEVMMRIPLAGVKKFDYPVFLVFMCFAVNLFTTAVLLGFMQLKLNRENKINMSSTSERKTVFDMLDWQIAGLGTIAATTNVLAMTMSLTAIKYVGVPTQIVIKSAKMIPILIGGFVLFKKRYPLYDYVAVFLITTFIFLFNYFKPTNKASAANTPFGLAMCFLSLLMDGITGPIEDKILALKDLHPYLLLFILNFFGFPVAFVAVFVAEGTAPMRIIWENPQLWVYVFALAFTASIGQVFIVLCLKLYGSLYTTLITTVRKIASSLLSIYTFQHPMSVMQWVSMSGTFATLLGRQVIKYKLGKKKGEQPNKQSGH